MNSYELHKRDLLRFRALSYYSDVTLSQAFKPMATQLSKKTALPLAKILAKASCHNSTTGPSTAYLLAWGWKICHAVLDRSFMFPVIWKKIFARVITMPLKVFNRICCCRDIYCKNIKTPPISKKVSFYSLSKLNLTPPPWKKRKNIWCSFVLCEYISIDQHKA